MNWKKYPALELSLALLIGISAGFHFYLMGLTLLFRKKHLWLVSVCGLIYFKLLYPSFPETQEGLALFHIEEVKPHSGPFHSSLVYIGTVKSFQTETATWHRIPARFYSSKRKNRPIANQDYLIPHTELIEIASKCYIIKSKEKWIPIPKTYSLAEWRYQTKERVKKSLRPLYRDKRVYDLMAGLLTGNLENRILTYQFGQVGLQHLLAISGFHFAILTFFLGFILKRFFSNRVMALCLISLLTLYFFYMGNAPSISRAWIGVMIYLIGLLFSFRPSALNALGVALLVALIIDPLVIIEVGFQLSFGATLGILLFYRLFEEKMQSILPKRPYQDLLQMHTLDQWGYLLCAYIRKVLALNGAVLTFTLPLLLFHFHSFPLLSLIYNLFIPLLFTFLMGGLLLSLVIPGMNTFTTLYANFVLDLIANAPKRMMFQMGIKEALWIGGIMGILLLRKSAALRWLRGKFWSFHKDLTGVLHR